MESVIFEVLFKKPFMSGFSEHQLRKIIREEARKATCVSCEEPIIDSAAPNIVPKILGKIFIDNSGGTGNQVVYISAGTDAVTDWIQISN